MTKVPNYHFPIELLVKQCDNSFPAHVNYYQYQEDRDMPDTMLNGQVEYRTWYDFKRDLERKLGRFLNVYMWLKAKPKKPLPWNDADLQTSLSEVLIQRTLRGESRRF